jgi:hypothetical protein
MRSRASFAMRAAVSRARSQRRSLHTTSATLAMGEGDDDPAAQCATAPQSRPRATLLGFPR